MSNLTRRLREKDIECNEAADRIEELEASFEKLFAMNKKQAEIIEELEAENAELTTDTTYLRSAEYW